MADDGEPETPPHHVRLNFGGGNEDESVSLMAVGTAEGTVEVVSVSQGALQPLSMNIVHSFKVCPHSHSHTLALLTLNTWRGCTFCGLMWGPVTR